MFHIPPCPTIAFATPSAITNRPSLRSFPHALQRVIRRPQIHTARMSRVLVPIGDGSEDIETATIVDTLRRAGANVTVGSVEQTDNITLARGLRMQTDAFVSALSASDFDAIALPGGMPGAVKLAACEPLVDMIRQFVKEGKLVAAVCASPAVVLAEQARVVDNTPMTCYPAEQFSSLVPVLQGGDVVVGDGAGGGKIVTGSGPGTALAWSLKVVELLYSKELADKLAGEMLVKA